MVLKPSDHLVPFRAPGIPEWFARLGEARYPTDVLVLDFETYHDQVYSLKRLSTIEYITDPRFRVLGLAWGYRNAAARQSGGLDIFWAEGDNSVKSALTDLQQRYGAQLERCTLIMHNDKFDASILSRHYGIVAPNVIDTMGLARHWFGRRKVELKTVAHDLGLKAKLDSQTVPLAEYAQNDVLRTWEAFTLLLPRLSWPSVELRAMQHTLDMFRSPILELDTVAAAILRQQMLDIVDQTVATCGGVSRSDISGERSFTQLISTALEAAGDSIDSYTKPAKNARGWKLAIAKTDDAREHLITHRDPTIRRLMEAKVAISSWPGHIKRIDNLVAQATAAGGRLSVPLHYCGAHTRRWSGGEGVNLHNLGDRGHELISAIRTLLIAPAGHVVVIADASQIEAVVLAWIAGEKDLCEQFRLRAPVYCNFATKVLGVPIRQPDPNGPIPEIEAYMKWARNSVGKVGVLGCGYGMGAATAYNYAGGLIDQATAARIVATYRKENQNIVGFWNGVERAFCFVVKYRNPTEFNGLQFSPRSDCDVVITLPSGGELKYHETRVIQEHRGPVLKVFNHLTKTWERVWGGVLTENIVQAISRDILWLGIQQVEDAGYRVALHIHDELVAVVPKEQGDAALATAIRALSTPPAWGLDLPLHAKGAITTCYGKH